MINIELFQQGDHASLDIHCTAAYDTELIHFASSFRLRHRLEEFQLPSANVNGARSPTGTTKTFLGQEVHVHHDCASTQGSSSKQRVSPLGKSASALPDNNNGALPNGHARASDGNRRDRSAPSSRPPVHDRRNGDSAVSRPRRRSHSSSEGEEAKPEREEARRGENGSRRGSRGRDLRRGSDSGLWSLTGALNGLSGNGNDVESVDRGEKGTGKDVHLSGGTNRIRKP